MSQNPEQEARKNIDNLLIQAGWVIQDMKTLNIMFSLGVAVREFPLDKGNGFADYLLYVDGRAIGVVEAKKEGSTLVGVETQSLKYATGLPSWVDAYQNPLPFSYESTGIETRFTNSLEPDAKSRQVFAFHRPEALLELVNREKQSMELMQILPPLDEKGLRKVQIEAINNLENSLKADKPRALIQMATGTGKTFTFCNIAYRLIKHTGAKRILFLVDRGNLARQTMKEFQNFSVPGDGRKFTELYNVQNMASNKIDEVAKVTICTIQRMYSMIAGVEMEEEMEEKSMIDFNMADMLKLPDDVSYNPLIPIESFDYIVVDECHRSIYNLWRQTLEYFDAKLIGLTATPSKQTIGFFNNNLVMEYNHERAVADGINVDFNVYKIETAIGTQGSKVESGYYIDKRDKLTRQVRYELLDNDFMYSAKDLDRSVVSLDQIRTVIRTFRDKLPTEIFPGRKEVPKTLIFAKDDSHAEDIVKIIREEFGKGNDFCQKITYKTTGRKPEDLISAFRNDYNPRIAVTVDMIATGTDIKPLEIVFFMRSVKSQLLFEQMKGRGVRVIDDNDFRQVTPDAERKTHFVIIDAVGVTEQDKTDTKPLDKQPTASFEKIMKVISMGNTEEDMLSTLVSRLSRISKSFTPAQNEELETIGGIGIHELSKNIIDAIDEDVILSKTLENTGKQDISELTEDEIRKTRKELAKIALKPLYNPAYRDRLMEIKKDNEQIIDSVSIDTLLFSGQSEDAKLKARGIVESFKHFIDENKDELELIKTYYNHSYKSKTTFEDVKSFAKKIDQIPALRNQSNLWRAYRTLMPEKVIESDSYTNADYISLLTFTLQYIDTLEPYRYRIESRFEQWVQEKEKAGVLWNVEQREWLEIIKEEISSSLSVSTEDFEYGNLLKKGGIGGAYKVFGNGLNGVIEEMNGVLV
ncbi:MAG: DEAD/DEAH box helicase family protein [Candidatus Gracilibacteria bacterium]|nr:DEAD/DEAH box helicase family protein [Candidatus Gracilibacteria bacterium]